jgi:hypothetical protein
MIGRAPLLTQFPLRVSSHPLLCSSAFSFFFLTLPSSVLFSCLHFPFPSHNLYSTFLSHFCFPLFTFAPFLCSILFASFVLSLVLPKRYTSSPMYGSCQMPLVPKCYPSSPICGSCQMPLVPKRYTSSPICGSCQMPLVPKRYTSTHPIERIPVAEATELWGQVRLGTVVLCCAVVQQVGAAPPGAVIVLWADTSQTVRPSRAT